MRSSLRRSVPIAGAVLLGSALLAPASFAGQAKDDGEKRAGRASSRADGAERGVEGIARVLRLNEDQKTEWRRVSREHQAEIRPLLREMRDLSAKMDEEATREAPDPAVIGQLELDRRDVFGRLRTARSEMDEDLVRLLDRDQRIRWETLRDRDRTGRSGAFDRRGFGPRRN